MKNNYQKALLTCLVMALLIPTVLAQYDQDFTEETAAKVLDFSTLTKEQAINMEQSRRQSSSTGGLYVLPDVANRAMEYRKILADKGAEAVAEMLMQSYSDDSANVEFGAAAFALIYDAGYITRKTRTGDRGLDRKLTQKKDAAAAALTKTALPIVDALAARPEPQAASAATELLLQIVSEGLLSSHLYADNGKRDTDTMPEELAAKASEFLENNDPFVRAMAEWAIEIKVGLDNDRQGDVWPGENPPQWFTAWMAVPEKDHLPFDYVRQAISLGMHRRPADLLRLARNVQQRAEGKIAWIKEEYLNAKEPAAAETMRNGLAQLEKTLTSGNDLAAQRQAWLDWRPTVRDAVMNTPDIDFSKLVYLERFSGGHHIQPSIHMNKYPAGGDIYVQDGLNPTDPHTPLLKDQLPKGYPQDLDLWYDADRLTFSWALKTRGDAQQIYEIGLDGQNLTQLTDSNEQDVDPAYAPDGSVVFGSSRARAGIMCGGGGHSQNNVYRVMPDTKEVLRLTYSPDDDAYPYVLNDGRVLYMRWDYQERGVDEIFSLWVTRPDGSASDGFYRVHINDKYIIQALKDAVPVPDSNMIVAMGSSHRAGNEGMVAIADPAKGINNPLGIRSVTPQHSVVGRGIGTLMRPVEEGGVPYIGGYYVKPYPITEKTFLVSSNYDMPTSANFQAYYIDAWGNKELLHRDKLMETVAVMPVRKRKKPPILPNLRQEDKNYATVFVSDVYADLPGVERGTIKEIRILEQLFWISGQRGGPLLFADTYRQSGGTGQGATRIIGTVPVAEDGSAFFEVPSDMPVYFQVVDKYHRGIQRMRTHVEFAPGEVRGCVGCHETRNSAVTANANLKMPRRKPDRPTPPAWGDSTFISYTDMIQPIFEAKCIKCHGKNEPKGGIMLTAEKDKKGYMQSYRSLFGLKLGQPIPTSYKERKALQDNETWNAMNDKVSLFLGETMGEVTDPRQFGSPQAPLATKLVTDEKHRKLLNDQEMQLIMTWLDIRAPYNDTYYQGNGKKYREVTVIPYEPFGDSRENKIKME